MRALCKTSQTTNAVLLQSKESPEDKIAHHQENASSPITMRDKDVSGDGDPNINVPTLSDQSKDFVHQHYLIKVKTTCFQC